MDNFCNKCLEEMSNLEQSYTINKKKVCKLCWLKNQMIWLKTSISKEEIRKNLEKLKGDK